MAAHFIELSSPGQNGLCASFNSSFRIEFLNQTMQLIVEIAWTKFNAMRNDFNHEQCRSLLDLSRSDRVFAAVYYVYYGCRAPSAPAAHRRRWIVNCFPTQTFISTGAVKWGIPMRKRISDKLEIHSVYDPTNSRNLILQIFLGIAFQNEIKNAKPGFHLRGNATKKDYLFWT